jgi:exodeoxyribonuclease-5
MSWSPQQDDALRQAADWIRNGDQQVFRMFGYAGTGKTTLAKHLTEGIDGDVLFAAFTGKAAYVLRQKGCPATTIHSLIYTSRDKGKAQILELEKTLAELKAELAKDGLTPEMINAHRRVMDMQKLIKKENENLSQPHFVKNLDSELRHAKLLIVDEVSMVDRIMGEDLLSFGTKILVLGDPAQLPPVKSEGFFTSVKPDVMLTEIHRQAQESGILRFATELRKGRAPRIGNYGPDCRVIPMSDVRSNTNLVLDIDQIIVGRNKTRSSYNHRVRQLRGMRGEQYPELPTAGDKLVCLKNNHEAGLLNGALFTVDQVGQVFDEKIAMEVIPETDEQICQTVSSHIHHFQGRAEDLPFWAKKDAEEFDYGYAMTCHKSQGSQWNRVIVFDESRSFGNNWHQWAYTAATRAAKDLTWVEMEA